MSVSPRDILTWAAATAHSNEVAVRAVISRAYYAAFHHCERWYLSLPGPHYPNSGHTSSHDALIRELLNPNAMWPSRERTAAIQVGGLLQGLRALRTLADYRLSRYVDPITAATAVADAQTIFQIAI
jgi:hypothetical protein